MHVDLLKTQTKFEKSQESEFKEIFFPKFPLDGVPLRDFKHKSKLKFHPKSSPPVVPFNSDAALAM